MSKHDTQVSLGAEQLQRLSAALGADTPCLSVFGGAFGCASFLSVTQHQRCGVVARMRHDRTLFHPPADDPRVKGAAHRRSMESASIAMMLQHGHASPIAALSPMPVMEQSFSNGGTACGCVRQPMISSIGIAAKRH